MDLDCEDFLRQLLYPVPWGVKVLKQELHLHKYGGGDQSMETTDHFNDFRGRKLTID